MAANPPAPDRVPWDPGALAALDAQRLRVGWDLETAEVRHRAAVALDPDSHLTHQTLGAVRALGQVRERLADSADCHHDPRAAERRQEQQATLGDRVQVALDNENTPLHDPTARAYHLAELLGTRATAHRYAAIATPWLPTRPFDRPPRPPRPPWLGTHEREVGDRGR